MQNRPTASPRPSRINRRHVLLTAAAGTASAGTWPTQAADRSTPSGAGQTHPVALAATWRGPTPDDPYHAGVLDAAENGIGLRVRWAQRLPSRAHGLARMPGGDLLVVAMRPGRWLLRLAANGQVQRLLALDDEPDGHRADGHALLSADGRVLYTAQTDRSGGGWIAVRNPANLALLDRWPAQGVDPHQLLLDSEGHLMLALGGIRRTPDGRKQALDRMASALVRLDGRSGAPLGRWTLPDARLSLRHLAWSHPPGGHAPLLGVALQAEHDDPADRAAAPLLAWWDGQRLQPALHAARHAGYAGDIAAAGEGGFALSAQPAGRGLLWQPGPPAQEQVFAQLHQPCALASEPGGAVWLATGPGLARWHPSEPGRLLRWPEPMVLDNHALRI